MSLHLAAPALLWTVCLTNMFPTHDGLHSCNIKRFPKALKSQGTSTKHQTPQPEAKCISTELRDGGARSSYMVLWLRPSSAITYIIYFLFF